MDMTRGALRGGFNIVIDACSDKVEGLIMIRALACFDNRPPDFTTFAFAQGH